MILPTFDLEKKLYAEGFKCIAGIDEAGRGAWAGPIVGAAVILPHDFNPASLPLRDSKLLSGKQREILYQLITQLAQGYAVTVIASDIIDCRGLTYANLQVISRSAADLKPAPDYLLIDQVTGKIDLACPGQTIIDGDAQICSIAAASILAKVTRDRIMRDLSTTYPQYGFDTHVGYGTKLHAAMLRTHGPCPIHRQSFAPIKNL